MMRNSAHILEVNQALIDLGFHEVSSEHCVA